MLRSELNALHAYTAMAAFADAAAAFADLSDDCLGCIVAFLELADVGAFRRISCATRGVHSFLWNRRRTPFERLAAVSRAPAGLRRWVVAHATDCYGCVDNSATPAIWHAEVRELLARAPPNLRRTDRMPAGVFWDVAKTRTECIRRDSPEGLAFLADCGLIDDEDGGELVEQALKQRRPRVLEFLIDTFDDCFCMDYGGAARYDPDFLCLEVVKNALGEPEERECIGWCAFCECSGATLEFLGERSPACGGPLPAWLRKELCSLRSPVELLAQILSRCACDRTRLAFFRNWFVPVVDQILSSYTRARVFETFLETKRDRTFYNPAVIRWIAKTWPDLCATSGNFLCVFLLAGFAGVCCDSNNDSDDDNRDRDDRDNRDRDNRDRDNRDNDNDRGDRDNRGDRDDRDDDRGDRDDRDNRDDRDDRDDRDNDGDACFADIAATFLAAASQDQLAALCPGVLEGCRRQATGSLWHVRLAAALDRFGRVFARPLLLEQGAECLCDQDTLDPANVAILAATHARARAAFSKLRPRELLARERAELVRPGAINTARILFAATPELSADPAALAETLRMIFLAPLAGLSSIATAGVCELLAALFACSPASLRAALEMPTIEPGLQLFLEDLPLTCKNNEILTLLKIGGADTTTPAPWLFKLFEHSRRHDFGSLRVLWEAGVAMASRALTERVAAVVFGCADMWARLCRPMVREFFAWAELRFPESLFAALESSPALAAALVLSGFDGRSCEHVWKTIPSFKIIARCKKNIAHYVGKNRFPPWCLGPAAIAALREKGADWSDLELVADEEGLAHIAAHASISEAAVVRLLHRCSENWETSSHTVGLARGPPPHECMRFARAINTFRVTPSLLERSGIEQKLRFLFADKTLERAAAAPAISDEGW